MSLSDEARADLRLSGNPCSVALLTEKHPELVDELAEAISDPTLSGASIARALRKRYGDEGPTDGTFNRHRNGQCACE